MSTFWILIIYTIFIAGVVVTAFVRYQKEKTIKKEFLASNDFKFNQSINTKSGSGMSFNASKLAQTFPSSLTDLKNAPDIRNRLLENVSTKFRIK